MSENNQYLEVLDNVYRNIDAALKSEDSYESKVSKVFPASMRALAKNAESLFDNNRILFIPSRVSSLSGKNSSNSVLENSGCFYYDSNKEAGLYATTYLAFILYYIAVTHIVTRKQSKLDKKRAA